LGEPFSFVLRGRMISSSDEVEESLLGEGDRTT
jgi:hypothetical protein